MSEAGGNISADKARTVRTPVSDRVEPKLKDLLGGKLGDVVLEAIRGVEAGSSEKVAGASVNAAAALRDAGAAKALAAEAKGTADAAVSTAGSAQSAAAAALEKAQGAKSAVDGLKFTAADGSEVSGPEAFTALAVQIQRNTGLLSEQLESTGRIADAAERVTGAAEQALAEARRAGESAIQAKADAEIAREQTETAARIVQGAAEAHSEELRGVEGELAGVKRVQGVIQNTLESLVKGLAEMKVSLRVIVKFAAANGIIPEEAAKTLIGDNTGVE